MMRIAFAEMMRCKIGLLTMPKITFQVKSVRCQVCGVSGTGSSIYRHERRQHGMNLHSRTMAVIWESAHGLEAVGPPAMSRTPDGHEESNGFPDGQREEADYGSEVDVQSVHCYNFSTPSPLAARESDAIDVVSDAASEDQLQDELREELIKFFAFLEIDKRINASVLDEVASRLHSFSTYGEVDRPGSNIFRKVMRTLRMDSACRRKTHYRGQFGATTGGMEWLPGVISSRQSMYMKPVSAHLRELMSKPAIVEAVFNDGPKAMDPWYTAHPEEFIYNFQTSERYSRIVADVGSAVIPIRVYGDAFGLHKLGAHRMEKNEAYGIYAQIASLPAHLSRKVTAWFTVAVCETSQVQTVHQCWAPVVSDLEQLQRDGCYVPVLGRVVKVLVVGYCGDLKDKNEVCNTAPPTASSYPHATCLVSRSQRHQASSYEDVNPLTTLRDRIEHESDIRKYAATGNLKTSRGVYGRSVLDPIADFLTRGFLTMDLAHTFHVGVFKSDFALCISLFIESGKLSDEGVSASLQDFKCRVLSGVDRSNFCANLVGQRSDSDGLLINLKGSISQMKLLAKYSTIAFRRLQESADCELLNLAWNVLVQLHRLNMYLESFALSRRQIQEVQRLLQIYIDTRIQLRDECERTMGPRYDLLPKHVDLMFAADNYSMSGPLVLTSTTTMESRHGHHKRTVERANNSKNVLKTLGARCELREKYFMDQLLSVPDLVPSKWGSGGVLQEFKDRIVGCVEAIGESGEVFGLLHVRGKRIASGNIVELYVNRECEETSMVRLIACTEDAGGNIYLHGLRLMYDYIPSHDIYGIRECADECQKWSVSQLANPAGYEVMNVQWRGYENIFTRGMIPAIR